MEYDKALTSLIKEMFSKQAEIPPIFDDKIFTFNLLYFIFNSIKCRRIHLTSSTEPYSAVTVFLIMAEDGRKKIIKIEASENNDKVFFKVYADDEESADQFYEQITRRLEGVKKGLKGENRAVIGKYVEVLKLIDSALNATLDKSIIREIYFHLANSREILYKIYEAERFEPILLSMASALEDLKKYGEDQKLIEAEYNKLSINLLKWKSEIIGKITVLTAG